MAAPMMRPRPLGCQEEEAAQAGTIGRARLNIGMRDAVRSLTSSPAPAVFAVLTLALSIGMNAGMVGLVDRALLSPPPHIVDPARIVTVAFERGEGDQRARMSSVSYVTYRSLRDNVSGFAAVAAWQPTSAAVAIDGEQIHADGMIVSGNYFALLGAAARI